MKTACLLALAIVVVWSSSPSATAQVSLDEAIADLTREDAIMQEANAARKAADYVTAREKAAEALSMLLSRPKHEQDGVWESLVYTAGWLAFESQDAHTANRAWKYLYDVRVATLPGDHTDLQMVRGGLAATYVQLGEFRKARTLQEEVLEVLVRTLPDDHPRLQIARGNLAISMASTGDLTGARALQEKALEVSSRTLADDHPDLLMARQNLAGTLFKLGDILGARALDEKVLEVQSRTLPEDHVNLQAARENLASTIREAGDHARARALQEKVLESRVRTLPEDHLVLQRTRSSLALTLSSLGELTEARALQETVLEVLSRTVPAGHPNLQMARQGLAQTLTWLGELEPARRLLEEAFEIYSTMYPHHPSLQRARVGLALAIANQLTASGRPSSAEQERTRARERRRCAELIGELCQAEVSVARVAIASSPAREAEERCARLTQSLDVALSFALGMGACDPLPELAPSAFALSEATRSAALSSAALTRRAKESPQYSALRRDLQEASDALARLARKPSTSEEFDRARTRRESAERELVALARELTGGGPTGLRFDAAELATHLSERRAAVGFRRFTRRSPIVPSGLGQTGAQPPEMSDRRVSSLCAFVIRGSAEDPDPGSRSDVSQLTLVDLGPMEPIEAAVTEWRRGLGVSDGSRGMPITLAAESSEIHPRGVRVRELVFDPLLPALAGAEDVVLTLDDVLHLVPFDALPSRDSEELLGDRWRIGTSASLGELAKISRPASTAGELVVFGDIDYGEAESASAPRRGPGSSGFTALPGTGVEAAGIARCFADRNEVDGAVTLCARTDATRERLLAVAPQASWLHIATHGWFAPESIRSWSDPEPLDSKTGPGMRTSASDQVKGMSPMLLCGLALAGANRPADAAGRAPGRLTADELSTLDLTNCELAVLSACDTNVGQKRAGQGVASLQRALQIAGARSVVTSLWKVPDEATKELMLDFYRRLWVEKKPKSQALWEAKTSLRRAKDEHGAPIYTTRDWAAWVLTGAPE